MTSPASSGTPHPGHDGDAGTTPAPGEVDWSHVYRLGPPDARRLLRAWVERMCAVTGLPLTSGSAQAAAAALPTISDPVVPLRALQHPDLTEEVIRAAHELTASELVDPDGWGPFDPAETLTGIATTAALLPGVGLPVTFVEALLRLLPLDRHWNQQRRLTGIWHEDTVGDTDPHQDQWGPESLCVACGDVSTGLLITHQVSGVVGVTEALSTPWALTYLRNAPDPDVALACARIGLPIREAASHAQRVLRDAATKAHVLAQVATLGALEATE